MIVVTVELVSAIDGHRELGTVSRGGRLIRFGECFLQAGWSLVEQKGCAFVWELRP